MNRKWIRRFWACLLAIAAAAVGFAQESKPSAKPTVDQLAWLAGAWRMERAGRVVDEQWMAPAGGVMLGMSRTVAKGKTLEHEFLQIREGPAGELFYIASPARQQETAFKLQTLSENAVAFENREHDFPQVITYALRPDGVLTATIEGPAANGQTRKIEFIYRRRAGTD